MRRCAFIFAVSVLSILFIFSGCGIVNQYNDKSMAFPQIRFFYTYNDEDWKLTNDHNGRRYSRIAFIDENGDYYSINDEYLCSVDFYELIDKYKNGDLSAYCSKRSLFDMTKKNNIYTEACAIVLSNDYKMIPSEMAITALTEEAEWYVVCYNKDGSLELKCIYRKDCALSNTPSDERATQIYEKINNAIKTH